MGEAKFESTVIFYDETVAPTPIGLDAIAWTRLRAADPEAVGYKAGNRNNGLDYMIHEGTEPADVLIRGFPVFRRSLYKSDPAEIHKGEIWGLAVTGPVSADFVSY